MRISVYFLFYVAMILELLIFIVDRDEAEQQIVNVGNLVTIYSQPLKILPPRQTQAGITTFTRDGQRVERAQPDTVSLLIPIINLISEPERKAVSYRVFDEQGNSVLPYTLDAAGNCIVKRVFSRDGTYRFTVCAMVNRKVPDYLPKRIRDELENELSKIFGRTLAVPSDTITFQIIAREQIQPLPPC